MTREPGFYWVREGGGPWRVMEWMTYFVPVSPTWAQFVFGPRIYPPDSPVAQAERALIHAAEAWSDEEEDPVAASGAIHGAVAMLRIRREEKKAEPCS